MGLQVLTVDDSAVMRKMIQRFVKEVLPDVTFGEAPNGLDGLNALGAKKYDLVISDWNMPGMDGISFVKEIRKKPPSAAQPKPVPILMVTTEGGEAKVKEALAAGADGLISKPFTTETIGKKVHEVLAKYGVQK